MKKKLTIGLAAIAVASTALGICYVANKQNCGDVSNVCPDQEIGSDIQCATEDKKDLNTETGTGYYLTTSSGNCVYRCTYHTPGTDTNRTYCGSITNSWNGYKPNSVACPSSGSGS